MKANLQAHQLEAFVDTELDLETRLEIEREMQSDPALREKIDGLRRLQASIREQADYHTVPPALRERLDAWIASEASQARRPSRVAAGIERWRGWRPFGAALALVAVGALALNLATLQSGRNARLEDEVVASHVRSTLGEHLVDVASSDHHTVKPWLSSKLDFSPPVDELHLPDCELLGGRIDYLDARPVAALVYRKGRHVVNAFVWPADGKDRKVGHDSQAEFSSERGFRIASWSQAGMTHWVVSDASPEELKSIVRAIQVAEGATRSAPR